MSTGKIRALQQTISTQAASGKGCDITEVSVEQKPKFKADLRVEVVTEDVILKDEEQMKQINETVEKLKDGSKSVRDDLNNGDMIFSDESSRVIFEMGNVEYLLQN